MAKPPSRTKRIWDAVKVDPQQIKGLIYVLAVVFAGGAGTGGFINEKLDKTQAAANSLIETNAAHAKQLLLNEVTRLTGIIDGLKTSAQAQVNEARAFAQVQVAQVQSNVNVRLQNTKEHEHLWSAWGTPQQIEGNFIQPQFFQSKECKICGEAELKKAARP